MKEYTIRLAAILVCGLIVFVSIFLANEETATKKETETETDTEIVVDDSLKNISLKDYEDAELVFISKGWHMSQLYYTSDNYKTIIQFDQETGKALFKYDLSDIIGRFPESRIKIMDVHDDTHQIVVGFYIYDGWQLNRREYWLVSAYSPVRINDNAENIADFEFLRNGDLVFVENQSFKIWHYKVGYFETIINNVIGISDIYYSDKIEVYICTKDGHIKYVFD